MIRPITKELAKKHLEEKQNREGILKPNLIKKKLIELQQRVHILIVEQFDLEIKCYEAGYKIVI